MSNSVMTVASASTLAKIGAKDAVVLAEVAALAAARASDQVAQSERELVDWFRAKGIIVNEVDRAAFRELVDPALVSADVPFTREQYERIKAMADL